MTNVFSFPDENGDPTPGIYRDAPKGKEGDVQSYSKDDPRIQAILNHPLTWDNIRSKRDNLLAATDWTQLADTFKDDADTKEAWETYRAALRDIPQDYDAPGDVVWPTPPG